MSTAYSAVVVGSTGLVGSHILKTLLEEHVLNFTKVTTLSRRIPRATSEKLNAITSDDSSSWAGNLSTLTPPPNIFFSALGTTKAAAGSFAAQYKIDHDLNVTLATAAKNAGIKTYVLISSSGANAKSYFAYPKMKGETEAAVIALGFEKTIILRPGMIVGERVEYDQRGLPEHVLMNVARFAGSWIGNRAADFWSQDAGVIARAAVNAGLRAERGEQKEEVWIMGQADIVRLGRTEWVGDKN